MANTFPAFLASLEQLKRRLEQGSADALVEHCDDVLEAANERGVVPYQTGALHDSGSRSAPVLTSGRATVSLSYDTSYALKVHEEPQEARRTGQRKWLEQTITAKADDLGPKLKAAVGL